MNTTTAEQSSVFGKPVWQVARFFPNQGQWTEDDFLQLSDRTNHPIELADGCLEFLPMPTDLHQRVLAYLYRELYAFVSNGKLGEVLFSALPMLLWEGRFREPDLLFMSVEHQDRIKREYWECADLVMEVVSEHNRDHDLVKKRAEYAKAGIPEYWIVAPAEAKITVLTLPEGASEYAVHGEFTPGQQATSALLAGFVVDVGEAIRGGR